MTRLKALPSHIIAARAARCDKCSGGHNPAKNSNFLVYSLISVSPGLKAGIIDHGRCDSDEVPVDPASVDPPSAVPSPGILDPQLPAEGNLSLGRLRKLRYQCRLCHNGNGLPSSTGKRWTSWSQNTWKWFCPPEQRNVLFMAAAPTIPSPQGIQKPPADRPPWATCLVGYDNPMVIRSTWQLVVDKNVPSTSTRVTSLAEENTIYIYIYIYIYILNIYPLKLLQTPLGTI